ncbi:MAG: glutamate--tRNA ligase [Thermoprotei archaeon]|nr:MAG: glutamate--tRNA ligase [Thermoprotei archaeon]
MEEVRRLALIYALQNAVRYGGRAMVKPVVSKLLGSRPELRSMAREVVKLVEEVVAEVNSMGLEKQRELLERLRPGALEEERRDEGRRGLPPLPRAEKGRVVTRFAPNPDFVLHLGSARPAIISYEYARMYGGRFILRFEDTDPKTKPPMPEAYEMIREDLRWLGLKWDEEHIQSLRMEVYYEHARRLIELGGAYVCTCSPERVRELRAAGVRCACAERSVEDQLELWDKMLGGEFGEGEAVLRVKTDIRHPNPSVRDWIAFRIIDTDRYPHPLTGSKYVVWPTYNFACGVDDHLMGVTHIFRGKEHEINTLKQKYLYEHFGWEYPVAVHFGRLSVEGVVLSKSRMREGIEKGFYRGFDDPRLATLRALRRRGILPEAIWDLILNVGIKPSSARISLENLYALNRRYVEPRANRYMFVPDPAPLEVRGARGELVAEIPRHPSHPERGVRRLKLKLTDGVARVYVPGGDLRGMRPGAELRLLGLANLRLVAEGVAEVVSADPGYAKARGLPIIQWCPAGSAVPATVLLARGSELEEVKGLAEPGVRELKEGDHAQFYRFGFVVLEDAREMRFVYSHD